jgi:gluconate:H+ symporter, GntP family
MIIGGGVDMPYVGFGLPLFLVSFPPAVLIAIYFRLRYLPEYKINEVLAYLKQSDDKKYSFKLYVPLFFVVIYMLAEVRFHEYLPQLGVPFIFIIGAMMGLLTKKGIKLIDASRKALRSAMPVMAILVGVGMFLQILALTGVRGYLAVIALDLPVSLRYFAAGLMPFIGSAYASSSIIGVPLVYVFIGKSTLMVTSALVLMASLGDMMPPPALLCAYAGEITGEKNHYRILKMSLIPVAITMLFAIVVLIYAQEISNFFL